MACYGGSNSAGAESRPPRLIDIIELFAVSAILPILPPMIRSAPTRTFAPDSKGEGARRLVAPYYRVLVDVADKRLHALPETFQMIPGMTVTAEMKVGHRSVISYFLYPLLRGLDESIREP